MNTNTLPPIESIADLKKHKRPKLVREHSDYIGLLIYHGGNEYPIEHYRMDTAEKVLWWIHHLCGKSNVTTEHIAQFIESSKKLGVSTEFHA